MDIVKPYWYVLINYWCRHLNRTGLTIPFIIGAQDYFLEKRVYTIERLLEEIKDTMCSEKVVIRECSHLNEYVIGLDENVYPIADLYKNFGEFCIADEELEKETDYSSLVNTLTNKYEKPVVEECFSKSVSLERWIKFNDEDIKMIKDAVNIY